MEINQKEAKTRKPNNTQIKKSHKQAKNKKTQQQHPIGDKAETRKPNKTQMEMSQKQAKNVKPNKTQMKKAHLKLRNWPRVKRRQQYQGGQEK